MVKSQALIFLVAFRYVLKFLWFLQSGKIISKRKEAVKAEWNFRWVWALPRMVQERGSMGRGTWIGQRHREKNFFVCPYFLSCLSVSLGFRILDGKV